MAWLDFEDPRNIRGVIVETDDKGLGTRELVPFPRIARIDTAADVARIVAWAYPERIARRRPGHRGLREVAYQCADGGEARLPETAPLAQREWLAIAHWEPGSHRRIRLAAAFDEAALRADHVEALRRDLDSRLLLQKIEKAFNNFWSVVAEMQVGNKQGAHRKLMM